MNTILIGIWLILFGVLALVSSEIPKWIVPLSAVVVGLVVLVNGGLKRA